MKTRILTPILKLGIAGRCALAVLLSLLFTTGLKAQLLTNIHLAPTNPVVAVGMPVAFTALGDYEDGSTQPLVTTNRGLWRALPPARTPRGNGVASAAANGRLYTVGGTDAQTLAFDPIARSWTTKASFGTPYRAHAAAAGIGTKLYIVGGCESMGRAPDCKNGTTAGLRVYDTRANSWRNAAPMTQARSSLAAATVDGKLYAIGGAGPCPPCTPYDTLECYNPVSNSWSTKAAMPIARSALAAVGLNGKIYVLGGANSTNSALTDLQAYDPATDAWSTLAPMPTGRQALGAAAVDGLIFAIGGLAATGPTNLVEIYNPATDTWSMGTPTQIAHSGAQPATIRETIYLAGCGPYNEAVTNVEAFTPALLWSSSSPEVAGAPTIDGLTIPITNGIAAISATAGILTGGATLSVTNPVFVVSNTEDSGGGSLRQAILNANAIPGTNHVITFNIPAKPPIAIRPLSELPLITRPVTIDATTQPGFTALPPIELNGELAGTNSDGFFIAASNCTIRGFVINRFSYAGVHSVSNGFTVVEGNFLGTDVSGTGGYGNKFGGVVLESPGNRVGGTNPAARNIISGNGLGVAVASPFASNNVVQGNLIGTDLTGKTAIPNHHGVYVHRSSRNLIGGTNAGSRNVISGNTQLGVYIRSNSGPNRVQGNYIGTDFAGVAQLGNGQEGVLISSGPGNLIGGLEPGAGNLISGNNGSAISIIFSSASNNIIQGNLLGTDVTGTTALPNKYEGVNIFQAPRNLIGGTNVAARNVISGNKQLGVVIGTNGATGNVVQGNFIGVDITGNTPLGNEAIGVGIIGGPGNFVGGTAGGAGNVISGNGISGVYIENAGAKGNLIAGNLIGMDSAGNKPMPNQRYGVHMEKASGNTVGGSSAVARNVISGNGDAGVAIENTGANGNVVAGNFIGTDITGTRAAGNGFDGISISLSSKNTIGGATPAAGNLIAFNGGAGVAISSGTANLVRMNSIFSNSQLGIALGARDALPNDSGDRDGGSNHQQNYPVLNAVSSTTNTVVSATLDSSARNTYQLDFYANTGSDPSGFGEGQTYPGSAKVVTDGLGKANFNVKFATVLAPGTFISATATSSGNDTSEFSPCLQTPIEPAAVIGGRTTYMPIAQPIVITPDIESIQVPAPFQITSVALQSNGALVTWTTLGGQSYVLQAGSCPNCLTDLSPAIAVAEGAGGTTNMLDRFPAGTPARFYRVRLEP